MSTPQVHILPRETIFVLNKNCTKHILPDNYGTVPGVENLMKQLHVWIRITLGIPQIQSYIKSVIGVRGTKRSSPLDIQEQ